MESNITEEPAAERRVCRDCEHVFTLSAQERRFFVTHRTPDGEPLRLPVRCDHCRQARRSATAAAHQERRAMKGSQ